MQDFVLSSYFQFLISTFGFKGPYEYKIGRWGGSYYVKGDIIVTFEYEGTYIAMIMKTKKVFPDLENGKLNLIDIRPQDYRYYNISQLDYKKRLWNSVSNENFKEKCYWYYENLIKNNSEILTGDFYKFSLRYLLLRKLKIKN
jgi:hypothetical protein